MIFEDVVAIYLFGGAVKTEETVMLVRQKDGKVVEES